MVLIIGGAYQVKFDYAKEHYGKDKIINNFHKKILELIKEGMNPLTYIKKNMGFYKDKIIISDDISCGVIPTDEAMRKYRELVGRSLALLSKNADEVIRVFCGMGTKIK